MMDVIGVIGGSGLYELDGLEQVEEIAVDTPFGSPSDLFIRGNLHGKTMIFLSRHGRGHRINPSEINYRANIFGMKKLGARWIISISAVGSLREHICPGDFVLPDQFIDLTKKREQTFFGEGIVAHLPFADPICPILSKALADAADSMGVSTHRTGTYVCIEGPQFSTRAESNLYRRWGADIIGMTNMPEAKLAREAQIAYATLALATDYDCWHQSEEDVSVEAILQIMAKNLKNARKTLALAVKQLHYEGKRSCDGVLKDTILTDPKAIPNGLKDKIAILLDRKMVKNEKV
jgi:5'-methylthioadenosine phosphorylase